MNEMPERDWKHLSREVKDRALDRYCRRVLDDVSRLVSDESCSSHERYLALFKLMRKRDEELGSCFNNLRRSSAIIQLTDMRRLGLVTDEEFAGFTEETRNRVEVILDIGR